MFCYNCGHPIDEPCNFCPNCGAKQDDANNGSNERGASKRTGDMAHGFIFTNIKALAHHVGARKQQVRNMLNSYVEQRQQCGVFYKIIDADDYTLQMQGKGFWHHNVSLTPADTWLQHQRLLVDAFYAEVTQNGIEPDYLFIIGGHTIIPIPELPIPVSNDESVDSDIPYSHLYDEQTAEMIKHNTIFRHPQHLFVGRLPLGADTKLSDIERHLQNAATVGKEGLPTALMYAQVDPHWKRVSMGVLENFMDFLPHCDMDNQYGFGSLILSPDVVASADGLKKDLIPVEEVFPVENASIFYFNQHGTNNPGVNPFKGQRDTQGREWKDSLYPKHMAAVKTLNIMVTEACYGAWHRRAIDNASPKQTSESICLSALYANTVGYLGATRVAYGNVDPSRTDATIGISGADIMARFFLEAVFDNQSLGEAFHKAKKEYANLEGKAGIDPSIMRVTLTEFNLYGDPSLMIAGTEEAYCHKSVDKSAISLLPPDAKISSETIYDRSQSVSILSLVRSAVDAAHAEIDRMITQHLYSNYNIQGCHLNRAEHFKVGNVDGYSYYYSADGTSYIVGLDQDKRIKNVLQAK